jgi:hypothetical protein
MARSRFLFDLLGTVVGLGILIPLAIFPNTGENYAGLGFTALGTVIGGLALGFIAYKKDGVKIAGAFAGLIAIFGIVVGVIMFAAGETVAKVFAENIFTLFVGFAGAIAMIIIGIIFIVVMIISSLLFVGFAAIGAAIGKSVWKDEAEEIAEKTGVYQTVQTAYQPVQPTQQYEQPAKQPGQVFCTNCGATNDAKIEFCTSCGAKLKKV